MGLGGGGRTRDGDRGAGPSRTPRPAGGRERKRGGWEGQGEPPPLAACRAHGSRAAPADSGCHSGCRSFTLQELPPSLSPFSGEVRSGGWRLQKLPRGALRAAPRACVASPPSRPCPAPFSTRILPRGSSHAPRWLEAPPTSPSARGSSLPPPAFLWFPSPSISLWKAPGTQGRLLGDRQPEGVAGVRPGRRGLLENRHRGGHGRSRRGCLAAPGTDRISAPALTVPGAARRKSGQLEGLLGTGRGGTGLATAAAPWPQTLPRPLLPAHSEWVETGGGTGELGGRRRRERFQPRAYRGPECQEKDVWETAVRLERKDPQRGKKHTRAHRSCGGLSWFRGDFQADSGNRRDASAARYSAILKT